MESTPSTSIDTGFADDAGSKFLLEDAEVIVPRNSLLLEKQMGIIEYVQDTTVGLSGKYKQR